MGKKKSDIYSCFQILAMKNKANKSIFMCKFCDRQYLQNATKMVNEQTLINTNIF